MGNKPVFIALLLLTLLITVSAAQETEEDSTSYIRQLVIEQKNDDESYTEILRQPTEETFVDVYQMSLGPGNYRYSLHSYDLLNQPQGTVEWSDFEIIFAMNPRISPGAFYLDEDTNWNIIISGLNFEQGTEVLLRQAGRPKDIVPETTVIASSGRIAMIHFAQFSLPPGNFTVIVRRPDGQETEAGPFRVAFSKPVDFNVSVGYAPIIPLYGSFFSFFDQGVFPLGVRGRLSLVPVKRVWGYLGVELNPFWHYMAAENPGQGYGLSSNLTGVDVRVLYQKWLPNRTMAVNLRLGTGILSILDFHFNDYVYDSVQDFTSLYVSVGADVSFLWLIRKPFFVEAGASFNHILATRDQTQPGFIRPQISAGWQY
jgi:hypothetical protein